MKKEMTSFQALYGILEKDVDFLKRQVHHPAHYSHVESVTEEGKGGGVDFSPKCDVMSINIQTLCIYPA